MGIESFDIEANRGEYPMVNDDAVRVRVTSGEADVLKELSPSHEVGVLQEPFFSAIVAHDRLRCDPDDDVHSLDLPNGVVDELLNAAVDPDREVPPYVRGNFESAARVLNIAAQVAIEHGFEPTVLVPQDYATPPSAG